MLETLPSGIVWISLVVIVVVGVLAIDRIVRGLVNRFTRAQSSYPHRVANQLPRTLHKGDFDEIVELMDDSVVDRNSRLLKMKPGLKGNYRRRLAQNTGIGSNHTLISNFLPLDRVPHCLSRECITN